MSMGAEWRVLHAQTREQGPLLDLAEILFLLSFFLSSEAFSFLPERRQLGQKKFHGFLREGLKKKNLIGIFQLEET